MSVEHQTPPGSDRRRRQEYAVRVAAPQPVFLIDTSGSMAPANRLPLVKQSSGLCWSNPLAPRSGEHRHLRRRVSLRLAPTPGDQKPHQGGDRGTGGRRVHERRRRDPGCLRPGRPIVHRRRRQPRHPGDRRRLQCRRGERGRAGPADRGEAEDRRVPDRPRVRHGQPEGRHAGKARPPRQRPLRLHRLARRGAQAVRRTGGVRWSPSRRT